MDKKCKKRAIINIKVENVSTLVGIGAREKETISTHNAKMRKIHEKIITFFEKCIDKTGKIGYIISVAVSTLVL